MAIDQAAIWTKEAEDLILQGKCIAATNLLKRAVRLDPDSSYCHMLLGIALSVLGAKFDAREALRRAVELDPLSAKAHYNLAVFMRDNDEEAGAILHASKSIALQPNDPDARSLLVELQGTSLQSNSAEVCPPSIVSSKET